MTSNHNNKDDTFEQMLRLLAEHADHRNLMHTRVAERVTMVTRFGLFMLVIIAISIYLLLNTLNSQVIHMLDGIETMNASFKQFDTNMAHIRRDLHNIEQQTNLMRNINNNTKQISLTMLGVHQSILRASQSIQHIRLGMQYVDQSMQQANQNLYPLTTNVYGISRDMDRVGDPFDTFNSFMP